MQAFCSNAEKILGICPDYSKTIFDNVDLPITDFKLNIRHLYNDYTKYPHKLIPVNLKCEIMPYLKKLSFSTYVLAGNSVANIIENVPIVGDLDFFVYADYLSAFEEITAGLNIIKIQAQPTLIDVFTPDLRISIIHTEYVDPANLIFNFDFDYCRAYMDKSGIFAYEEALFSIATKTVIQPAKFRKIRDFRVQKALKYGYSFGSIILRNIPNNKKIFEFQDNYSHDYIITPVKLIDNIICRTGTIITFDEFIDLVILTKEYIELKAGFEFDESVEIDDKILSNHFVKCGMRTCNYESVEKCIIRYLGYICKIEHDHTDKKMCLKYIHQHIVSINKINDIHVKLIAIRDKLSYPLIIHETNYIDDTIYRIINMIINKNVDEIKVDYYEYTIEFPLPKSATI